jgi:hypothetical protein
MKSAVNTYRVYHTYRTAWIKDVLQTCSLAASPARSQQQWLATDQTVDLNQDATIIVSFVHHQPINLVSHINKGS